MTSPHRSRRRSAVMSAMVLIGGVGGYCAVGASAGVGQAASGLSADPQATAGQEAAAILALAPVSPGAQALVSPPPGAPELDQAATLPGSSDLVDLSALWTATGTMDGVWGWERANTPLGGSAMGYGFSGGPLPADDVDEVMWGFTTSTPSIQSSELEVTVAQVADGVVGIRADAMVSYYPVRPAWSLVSASAVAGMSAGSGQCGAHPCTSGLGRSSDRSEIDALVSTLDALPVAPDEAVSCGAVTAGSFFGVALTSATGTLVATVGGTWACGGYSVTVPRGGTVGLADPAGAFAKLLGADFGIPGSLHLGIG